MNFRKLVQRAVVLAEITVVFLGATIGARYLMRALGIGSSKDAISSAQATGFDAGAVAVPLSIRWILVIALAFLVGNALGGHRMRDYGVTLAGKPIGWHVRAGAIAYAIGCIPVMLLMIARYGLDLQGGPPFWDVMDRASWGFGFWLFILASAVVLPPLFEELFFRGYSLTRLETVFAPITAAVLIATLFMLAHTQYLDGSLIGTGMLLTSIWAMSVLGIARLRTGSLVAPVLAHALSNIPMTLTVRLVVLPLMILVAVAAFRVPLVRRSQKAVF